MKTEEEARQCWCPAVRFTGAGTATDQEWGTNRGQDHGPEAFNCIASECMAWRESAQFMQNWHSKPDVPPPIPDDGWQSHGDVEETTGDLPKSEREAGTRQYRQMFKKTNGFCGLAGKPE